MISKTKEEILEMIKDDTLSEWLLEQQTVTEYQTNKNIADKVSDILNDLVSDGVITPYEIRPYSGSFGFTKIPTIIEE
jgi:hypothetical protein